MANHKSALKAHRRSETRKLIRQSKISKIKTFIKKAEEAFSSKDLAAATEAFKVAESKIVSSVNKGIMHKNTAARRVKRLARKFKSLESAA